MVATWQLLIALIAKFSVEKSEGTEAICLIQIGKLKIMMEQLIVFVFVVMGLWLVFRQNPKKKYVDEKVKEEKVDLLKHILEVDKSFSGYDDSKINKRL